MAISKVTDVLSNAECAAFEELWHDDLLRLLDGHKVEGEAPCRVSFNGFQQPNIGGVQLKLGEAKYLLMLCAGDKNIEPLIFGLFLAFDWFCSGGAMDQILRSENHAFFQAFPCAQSFYLSVSVCAFKCVCSVGIC